MFDSLPIPPVHLFTPATGVGKTRTALKWIKETIGSIPGTMCIVIATPTHALNDELVNLLHLEHGIVAAIYRGREASDPARNGMQMCDFAEQAKDLSNLGGNPQNLCSRKRKGAVVRCQSYDICGYRRQRTEKVKVWIVPHAMLPKGRPSFIPDLAALIIDEDCIQVFFGGFGRAVRVSFDELRNNRFIPLKPGSKKADDSAMNDLDFASKRLLAAFAKLESNKPIPASMLLDAGLSEEMAREARKSTFASIKPLDVGPDTTPSQMDEKLREAAKNRPIHRLARMWQLITDALSSQSPIVSGIRLERGTTSSDGTQYDAVRLRWLDKPHDDWDAPTAILSATANPDLLKPLWPQLEHVVKINPETPFCHVRQILWSAAQRRVQLDGNINRIRRYIETRAFAFRGKGKEIAGTKIDVLVICQQKLEAKLEDLDLPKNVDIAHFNAVAGIDKWGGVACVISIGRTMPSPDDIELMAEVLSGEPVGRSEDFPNGYYPYTDAGIRIRGTEVGVVTITEKHTDALAESIRRNIAEAQLIQAIGRARAVNRTSLDPLQIDIFGTLPLPLDVDEVLSWEDSHPSPFDVMAARGLIVSRAATMGKWNVIAKVLRDLYPSAEAVRKSLTRTNPNNIYILENVRVSDFKPATIRLQNSRYSVPVLIDARRGDLRETTERLIGPLDLFKTEAAYGEMPIHGEVIQRIDIGLPPIDGAAPTPRPETPKRPVLKIDNKPVQHSKIASRLRQIARTYQEVANSMEDAEWLDPEAGLKAARLWLDAASGEGVENAETSQNNVTKKSKAR